MPGAVAGAVVLGVGNLLRQDEGVGIHALHRLVGCVTESDAAVVDGGTAAFDALASWSRIGKLVIIDALRAGKQPGSITRLSLRDLADRTWPVLSVHDHSLMDALAMLQQAGLRVGEIVIYGVEPANTDWGDQLSEPVADCLPFLVAQIKAELSSPCAQEEPQ